MSAPETTVSVVIVTYEPEPDVLLRCLDSIAQSEYPPSELIVVDNASRKTDVLAELTTWVAQQAGWPVRTILLPQVRNIGYAAATNRGVAAASGEFVLLLNPDARLDSDTLLRLIEAARRRPSAHGFAPKVLLERQAPIVDSVGLDLLRDGQGSQRGLGQPDIGQFDVEEPIAGLCFASALVRRTLFSGSQVGPLDERYFMFYEDVDWSLRARLLGYVFWTAPSARVHHLHSATARHLGSGFKTRLIQRNLMWTVAKSAERRRVAPVLLLRTLVNSLRIVRGSDKTATARALVEAWAGMPLMIPSRRRLQRRRILDDRTALAKRAEPTFFDPRTHGPIPSTAMLVAALTRLCVVAPDPRLERVLVRIAAAACTSLGRDPARMAQIVRDEGIVAGPGLEWLLGLLEETVPPDDTVATSMLAGV